MTELSLDFEQRHRLITEVLPAVIDDPEYAAAQIIRLESKCRELEEALIQCNADKRTVYLQRDNNLERVAEAKLIEQENQRLRDFDLAAVIAGRKIRTHCAHWSVDEVLDEVIALHNKYFRQTAEGEGDE